VIPHNHDGLAAEVAQVVESADVDAATAAFDQADVAGGIGNLRFLVELAMRGGVAAEKERKEVALVELPAAVKPQMKREGRAVGLGRIVTVHAFEEIIRHFGTVCVMKMNTRGAADRRSPRRKTPKQLT